MLRPAAGWCTSIPVAVSFRAMRITVFYGRRGRPVKKPRFIPAELAHQWARKLQARRIGTVSVL